MFQNLKPLPLRALLLVGALGTPLLQVSSCSSGTPEAPNQEALIEKGNALSDSLMKNLGGQLKASLANGDPSKAVEFCAQVAIPITDQASSESANAVVTRTSLRYRNLANSPDEVDQRILEKWESDAKEGKPLPPYELTAAGDNSTRFYRPIRVQKLCLTCHGDPQTFSPELTAVLKERYPKDLATGYAEGDLRGAFRVEFSED